MGRILILGIDGAEPSLLFDWADAGHLPNFARLMQRAAWGPLRSTTHPLTPQAWTSLITGVNPGRHGIFDFGRRAAGGYNVELVTSRDRAAPAFWQFMPAGMRVGVANVPLTWPPEPVPGFMVTGMQTPKIEDGVWPPELLADLGDGYRVDAMVHWYEEPGRFLADLYAMHDARHAAFLRLWDHHSPDLALLVYVAADRVQHAYWGAMTPEHRRQPGIQQDLGDSIFDIYLAMDRVLADWMARLEPDDHLLIVSDHGFGELRRDVYLNRALIDAGLLRFDPSKVRAFIPALPESTEDIQHSWMQDRLPPREPLPEDGEALVRGLCDPRYLDFATVDWRRTYAYSRGLFGNVWLNLAGREPEGIVRPTEVKDIRAHVTAALKKIMDPDDGRPVVDRIIPKEDIYSGECLDQAPDLLVIMRNYAYITRGATEFWGRQTVGPVVVGHTGNHRLDGVFLAVGPKIGSGKYSAMNILDVLPTVFQIAGWPVPADLEGQVLTRILKPDFHSIRSGPPTPQITRDPRTYAEEERKIIINRLRALGYLG